MLEFAASFITQDRSISRAKAEKPGDLRHVSP